MINRVVLTGRLTQNIEIRRTNDGIPYTFFTIAVNRSSNKDQTDFISCVAWRGTAELMNNYLTKGSLIGIEGRLEVYRVASDGDYQTRTNVNVSNVTFLETKAQADARTQETQAFNNNPSPQPTQNQQPQQPQSSEKQDSVNIDDIDFDEIKF